MPKNVLMTQSAFSELVAQLKLDPETPIADKFEIMAHLFLEQALDQMINMSSKDAMIGAGIAIDKMQLLRGLPTEIKASVPILIQIALRANEENIKLETVLMKVLNAMNE